MLRTLTFPLLLASLLPAQAGQSPFRFVPKDSFVVLSAKGPGAWQKEFAGTRVAKLLGGATLAPLLEDAKQALDTAVKQGAGKAPFDLETFWKEAVAYEGQLVVGARIDWSSLAQAIDAEEPPSFSVVAVLAPDGTRDLAAMAQKLSELAEREGGLRDLKVGDMTLRVAKHETDGKAVELSLPAMVGDCLVAFVGTDLAALAREALEPKAGKSYEPGPELARATLGTAVHLEGFLGVIKELVAREADAPEGVDVGALLDQVGLACVKELGLWLGAEGKYVALDAELAFNDKPRGLFEVLGTPGKHELALLELLPAGIESFSDYHVDFAAIYRTLAKVWDSVGAAVPLKREDGEKKFEEQCKVRLREDLLDHLGSEFLSLTDPRDRAARRKGSPDDEDPIEAFSGTCVVVALKDGRAFGTAFEKLLRSRGLHASRKTEEYQGEKVHRLAPLPSFQIEYAITEGFLVVGIGKSEAAGKALRGVLDERAARRAGKPADGLSESVKAVLADLPKHWSQLEQLDILSLFDPIMGGLSAGASVSGDDSLVAKLDEVGKVLARLRPELVQLGLDKRVGTSYVEAKRFLTKTRW